MAVEVSEQLAAHHGNSLDGVQLEPSKLGAAGSVDLDRYIPLGSFSVLLENNDLLLHSEWNELDSTGLTALSSEAGKHLIHLTSKYWTRVFVRQDPDNGCQCTLRIYLLPDDVGRVQIPRSQRKLRPHLRWILNHINRSSQAWAGRQWEKNDAVGYHSAAAEDDSLFYIFNTLESPNPVPSDVDDYYAANMMQDLLEGGKVDLGLKTELYQYQRRSCARMVQRETQPELRLDPRLEIMTGPTGMRFYLDRDKCEVLCEPRSYQEARGGILAETMGYGKTLICLATIIATRGRLPETPPEFSTSLGSYPRVTGPRSLADTSALNIAKHNIQWKLYFRELAKGGDHFDGCIRMLERTIGRYKIPTVKGRSRRAATVVQTMYLASTTLIVVPPNLLKQWQREIHYHVRPKVLSRLLVDDSRVTLPQAEELRQYDLVLMSSQRFEEEMFPLGGNRGDSDAILCSCSNPAKRRFCQEHPYRSPLRDVHFLRIIVDEGQRFVSGSTTQAIMALKCIKVDAKWIVSGTPAGGLVGAEVNLAAEESFTDFQPDQVDSDYPLAHHSSGLATNDALDFQELKSYPSPLARDATSNGTLTTTEMPLKMRWNLEDRKRAKDLEEERKSIERLGNIVKSFLRVQPWANDDLEDGASWNTYVVPNKNGSRKPLSLRSVLNGLVVRHQYEHVEYDLRLPPLENKLVSLQPCFFDKLSINLFVLALTTNAVTSEKKDQDYMFHPRNRKSLEVLIRNLRHSGFTWSGFLPEEIEKICSVGRSYLVKQDVVISQEDRVLLEGAIAVGDLAVNNPARRAFSQLGEIGLAVVGLLQEHKQSVALCPEVEPRADPLLIGAMQLCAVQEAVEGELYSYDFQKAIRSLGQSRHNGTTNGEKKSEHSSMLQDSPRKSSEPGKGIPQSGILEVKKISASRFSNVTTRQRPLTVSEEERILESKRVATNGKLKSILRRVEKKPDIPPAYRVLSQTQLVGTSSAKLSYLIDKVYSLYKNEKILVFYEGDDIAWYCAQAFELLGIPHLIYARGISQQLRNDYQTMFNTGSIYRVLLMDLKQAALGLHMASASRVFFINPVWQPAIEAQAIKRAHRIGQTKPVFVETLVLKGTIEEQMLQRRKSMSVEEHQKAARSLLDDTPMKDIILNASLLPISPEEVSEHSLQIAPLREPQQLFARSIVSAYGSHHTLIEALDKIESTQSAKAGHINGDSSDRTPDSRTMGTSTDSRNESQLKPTHTNGAHSRPISKKRKLVFVDELERRKVALADRDAERRAPDAEVDDDMPCAKRRRSSNIVFADEKDLPLSTVFVLPDEDSVPDGLDGDDTQIQRSS